MTLLRLAFRRDIVRRSLVVAVVVGTILNLINQGDAIFGPAPVDFVKLGLTCVVPYCVATYGAVTALAAGAKAARQAETASGRR